MLLAPQAPGRRGRRGGAGRGLDAPRRQPQRLRLAHGLRPRRPPRRGAAHRPAQPHALRQDHRRDARDPPRVPSSPVRAFARPETKTKRARQVKVAETQGAALTELVCYADSNLSRYDALGGGRCPRLRTLDCTGSRRLSGAAVAAVAGTAKASLTSLNLSWCVNVDDAALLGVAAHCPGLKTLSVHGSTRVSDVGVAALAGSPTARALTALDVSGCVRVTDYLRRAGTLAPRFPNVATWTLHT